MELCAGIKNHKKNNIAILINVNHKQWKDKGQNWTIKLQQKYKHKTKFS